MKKISLFLSVIVVALLSCPIQALAQGPPPGEDLGPIGTVVVFGGLAIMGLYVGYHILSLLAMIYAELPLSLQILIPIIVAAVIAYFIVF